MDLRDSLDVLMFVAACAVLLTGFPVAFTLAGVALAFGLIGMAFGVFDFGFMAALPQRIYGNMTNEVLIAVPLFVFMGTMLERSRVAEDLLENMGRLFGRLRGGLGFSVSIVGALLAASTGIVGATVVTMGLLALPTMLRRGYDPSLATGSIAAAGTLGQIIPPSIVLVLLGDTLANSYQKAQLEQGIFSPETLSVGDLFAGALIPGLMLVGFYILYQVFRAAFDPKSSPAMPVEDDISTAELYRRTLQALVPPVALIVAVMGSILGGIATPTEAAALGAIGAILLAGERAGGMKRAVRSAAAALIALLLLTSFMDLRTARTEISGIDQFAILAAYILCAIVAIGLGASVWRLWRSGVLGEVSQSTARITSMVFVILIGAALFSLVFRGLGGDETVQEFLTSMPGGTTGAIVTVMAIMFLLGFFLDFIEIIFVVVPIVAPILLMMGVDPVWLGVMMAINLQTSFLTPPFGFALFYLRGVAPDSVTTMQIYRGAVPFVGLQIVALGVIALFPALATWLPRLLFSAM
ncbi:TRAP transporter large permease subunit [Parvibaculum sp.]|jgi:tripartite ATP-independent transporter DctM subunit|uniref:TRAP transporter large permease n=4 Tax=Parvibaculum sp. TaxID=2024848 RepID=UPI001B0F3868|nr:TRAP transporter large permease subunit [Parvibaculum sp.]MBO6680204.1 TRAP transporter large permease subunit [Parvibaculum sp.]MBO6903493.1 TRAP transporter large permease subunit [Parvibaculum sp.]